MLVLFQCLLFPVFVKAAAIALTADCREPAWAAWPADLFSWHVRGLPAPDAHPCCWNAAVQRSNSRQPNLSTVSHGKSVLGRVRGNGSTTQTPQHWWPATRCDGQPLWYCAWIRAGLENACSVPRLPSAVNGNSLGSPRCRKYAASIL